MRQRERETAEGHLVLSLSQAHIFISENVTKTERRREECIVSNP